MVKHESLRIAGSVLVLEEVQLALQKGLLGEVLRRTNLALQTRPI